MRRGPAQSWRREASVSKMAGASGQKLPIPGAVDAAVDEMDGLAGVEEQGGAGGEFAVDDDEVVGLRVGALVGEDGVGEALRAEGGVEADEACVHAEQQAGGGGGEREVGGVGAAASAEKVACTGRWRSC